MRLTMIALALCCAGPLALPLPAPALAQACETADPDGQRRDLLAGLNALRATSGLPGLQLDRRLTRVAQRHACDNARRNSYSHSGSDGSDLAQRLDRGGYRWRAAAENTGLGQRTPADMAAFWARSPGHRANILNADLREAGIGLARSADGRNVWVLVLGRR